MARSIERSIDAFLPFFPFCSPCSSPPAQSTSQAAAPTAVLASLPVNAVTQAALQQGVLNCAVRINQGEHFLCFNAQAGAVLMTPSAQPDRQLVDAAAREQHPLRWKRRPRAWTAPEHVWLNPPAKADEAAQTRKAA